MKKILLSIVGFVLCAVCLFTAVGCKPTDYGTTTTLTDHVTANGGAAVVYKDGDGKNYLYFANGVLSNTEENNGKTVGGIYKVEISADGTIAEDATYEKVVDTLVGYNKGSINIIGDFLYYTTPGTGEDKTGNVLFDKTVFMRKNLKNGKIQEIYKTAQNSADEAVTFAYYKTAENQSELHLVVYEATSKTLKSFKIGNKIEEVFSKENVTSAVFSETMGSTADNAENFVFYTLAAETNAINTSTNRVYRIGADGSDETLINDNANITLEAVKGGKLIFVVSFGSSPEQITNTYAYPVTSATQNGDIKVVDENNSKNPYAGPDADKYIICRNDYSTMMYIEDGDYIGILYLEGKNLIYERFEGNTSSAVSYIIHTFETTPTINFIGTFVDDLNDGNHEYVVFLNKDGSKNIVYKVRFDFVDEADCLQNRENPETLTTTNALVESSSSSSDSVKLGNMLPKVIGNDAYIFAKDEDGNILLHKVHLFTPKELNDLNPPAEEPDKEDLELKAADLVGGPEI